MQKIVLIIFCGFLTGGCSVVLNTGRNETDGQRKSMEFIGDFAGQNLTKHEFTIRKADVKIRFEGKEFNLIALVSYNLNNSFTISVRNKTGIEVARGIISDDTLLINDRINRKLYRGEPGYIENKFGIRPSLLPVLFGDFVDDKENYSLKPDCKNGIAPYKYTAEPNNVYYSLNCDRGKVDRLIISDLTDSEIIKIEYKNFFNSGLNTMPREILIKSPKNNLSMELRIGTILMDNTNALNFIPGEKYIIEELR